MKLKAILKVLLLAVAMTLMAIPVSLIGCVPQKAPSAIPATPAPLPARAIPTTAAPVMGPEEAAWAKVVAEAKKEGRVTCYSYNFTGDVGTAIDRAFSQRYGIDVECITGRGAEFIERLKVERRMGKMTADIFEGSDSHTMNVKLAGLGASSADLPVLREKDAWIMDPLSLDKEGHMLGYVQYSNANWVNTNLVKPGEEPRSYKDLLQPKWADKKIVISDPEISVSPHRFEAYVIRGRLPSNYLEELGKQHLRFSRGNQDALEFLARGEVMVGLIITSADAAIFIKQGAPIKIIDMEEGTIMNLLMIEAIKDAPHPNASKVFINWLLSPEGQNIFCQGKGTVSMRKGMQSFLPPAATLEPKNPLIWTAEDSEKSSDSLRRKDIVPLLKSPK